MSEIGKRDDRGGLSMRGAELGVAAAIMSLGALVMYDNWQLGARWAADGPQAGYFPFYVGLLMLISSAIVFVRALVARKPRKHFVDPARFRSVLALLVPAIIYVAVTALVGIYVASAIFLAYFMRVLGRYRWRTVAVIAVGLPVALFLVFEMWFLVPLPKGPLEVWLGY